VVASLLPAMAVGKEPGCTAATGTIGDCRNTAIEYDIDVLKVGYTSYGTSEEHR
jgi:hypothetical protein